MCVCVVPGYWWGMDMKVALQATRHPREFDHSSYVPAALPLWPAVCHLCPLQCSAFLCPNCPSLDLPYPHQHEDFLHSFITPRDPDPPTRSGPNKKKWTDFNTKEANNLTNKQKPKKKTLKRKKSFPLGRIGCVFFCGKEILWAMILCEREKKRKWGGGGEGWLTDLGGAGIFSCTEDSIECHLFSHIRNRDDRQETSIRHKPQKARLQE